MSDENNFPRTKKRIRRPTCHKKYLNKQKVEKGLEHFSPSGNLIPAKTFQVQIECKCTKQCAIKIDVQRQYEIFKTFYDLKSWSSKTLFLRGCMSRIQVENRLSDQNPILPLCRISYNYMYKLLDRNAIEHQVCKEFFLYNVFNLFILCVEIENIIQSKCKSKNVELNYRLKINRNTIEKC